MTEPRGRAPDRRVSTAEPDGAVRGPQVLATNRDLNVAGAGWIRFRPGRRRGQDVGLGGKVGDADRAGHPVGAVVAVARRGFLCR